MDETPKMESDKVTGPKPDKDGAETVRPTTQISPGPLLNTSTTILPPLISQRYVFYGRRYH
jgi:hypothetical protein